MTWLSGIRHGAVCGALICVALATPPVLFNGTFHGNEAESKMLPGQHVPPDFVGVMKDNGVVFQTIQTFTAPDGQRVRYVWKGRCDGQLSSVQGAPGGVKFGCERTSKGEMITTVADDHGYKHVETCVMSRDGTRETCSGTATLPDGSKHDFVYVFDRN